MADLRKLAQAMCSIELADSHWTQELPRLPIPDLWLTVSRYLASLKAVLAPDNEEPSIGGDQQMGDEKRKLAPRALGCNWSDEERAANRSQFERTDQLVKQFMLNEGPQLQRDLREYANKCQNWATEFWLRDMYLSNSLPLPVNSNPFFMFPRQQFESSLEMLMFATRIIQFSVDFKYRIDQQTIRQDFGSGHGKGKPLCMETYKNFFHSYRMPHEQMDRLLPQSRRSNHIVVASCNQFYILRLGQEPLPNPYRRDTSSQLNEASIFEQLLRIYRVSREHAKRELMKDTANKSNIEQQENSSSIIHKVGLFTTENRKIWAKMHKKLSHCNGQAAGSSPASKSCNGICGGPNSPNTNTESLRQIEDCLFVMCLDSLVSPSSGSPPKQAPKGTTNENDELVEHAKIILTGAGSAKFTANRWFDKFLQIIVGRDGVCGINIEHSASEGVTVLRFLEEFLSFIKTNPIGDPKRLETFNYPLIKTQSREGSGAGSGGEFNSLLSAQDKLGAHSITSPGYVEPKSPSALLEESDNIKPLSWILDDELIKGLQEAEVRANQLVDNFSLYILNFTQFGRNFIKEQNLSPDAFIQLAMQYTFYRIHGFLVSTYESASLRQFRLGRVDNIRANTCEAYQWIQAMLACKEATTNFNSSTAASKSTSFANNNQRWKSAEASFIKAMTKQVEILRYTIIGGGPDNHLLALKQLAHNRYYDDELPEIFTDQSYKEFLNFRLSTSQLLNESNIVVGYGAVVPNGYGCSYNPCEERLVFCISSFLDCPETSSSNFAKVLSECLLEMQQLCLGRGNFIKK